ncbi:MAG: helix-turn-helix domain-containing protein [Bacilli bacterium]|nr:helix-turn-helix domain-containing protein [Bacilli bacterium]
MEIGEKIEKILETSEMTQRDLANKIGLDETILSRIIKGERNPKAEVLANIATALHVTTDYLLDVENSDEFDSKKEIRLIARNSSKLTKEDKKELMNILLS